MRQMNALCMLAATWLAVSCASSAKLQTRQVSEYTVTPATQAKQTKSSVTIEAEVLKPSEGYSKPELFSFDLDQVPDAYGNAYLFYPEDAQGKRWCYTFGYGEKYLTALKVKLTNNTSHILRMKDARIYLVVEGESPIAAVNKLGNTNLVGVSAGKDKEKYLPKSFVDQDNSLVHWLTHFENEWDRTRKKGLIRIGYPVGFASQVVAQNRKRYKLINDLSVEILPEFSHEGILLFPAVVSWEQAKLMFYDITTKTDAAGNPTEKASFAFPLALEQTNMWYDRAAKIWKTGSPPVAAK